VWVSTLPPVPALPADATQSSELSKLSCYRKVRPMPSAATWSPHRSAPQCGPIPAQPSHRHSTQLTPARCHPGRSAARTGPPAPR
jgi:hypothetical protein